MPHEQPGNPPDLRSDLADHGYSVIRGLLPAREIQAISEGFDRLLEIARRLGETADVEGSRFVVRADPFRVERVVWCVGLLAFECVLVAGVEDGGLDDIGDRGLRVRKGGLPPLF